MDHSEIVARVKPLFVRIMGDEVEFSESLASRDIKKWDSLNHVMLITEVEKEFGIKFDLMDMLEMRSIGDICKGVEKQVAAK